MTIEEIYTIFLQNPVICTDTRRVENGCLFFALKGPNFNANAFASDALLKGAAYAIVDDATLDPNPNFIFVKDVLETLQALATHHRKQLEIEVIAIVGSNGKTTTKELITSVLQTSKRVHATPGNFNNHIGLPLTLLQLNTSHEIAVIEMGANHIGENALLCEIAQPNTGIVTNNGKDHLEGFGSIEGVAKSNSELYYYLLKNGGHAFVNAKDEWLIRMATRLERKTTYAANTQLQFVEANCKGLAHQLQPTIEFTLSSATEHIKSYLSGDYNFDNIMAAVCIGAYYGVPYEGIKRGIESYKPQNNRSQVIETKFNTILLDAYNANPSSMEASLKNFAAMPYKSKVAILGDMFELGDYAAQEHAQLIAFIKTLPINEVIFVGSLFKAQSSANETVFETTEEAIAYIQKADFKQKHVFLKGSRGMKLEQIVSVIP
ncbi:MAG: UDP-N-acetylmuramoyl-tripeptide--D-alanyl-D-alanine ligase [Bacteroidia bacterium]|jgi:UDP-N-acetylmuramoyl-tripeptide--D-alanyl-D-alanine ligase|nr:UDP-N-acetylmuramoyl-tripeptide--D-alanyl-D-alanine ligase [Bacteroidia bacterium]